MEKSEIKVTRDVKDWDELVPMLNKVFKKKFKTLLPKIYTEDRFMKDHFVVRDNGRIIANVGSLRTQLACGENILEGRGIGMVAVLKSHRNMGLMNTLMTAAVDAAKDENADFMFLGGNRKRYERYGFVPCGTTLKYQLIKENVKHSKASCELEFKLMDEDSPYLAKVIELYNSQDIRYIRDDFYKVLRTWGAKKFYAILKDGEVAGHIVSHRTVIEDFNIIGVSSADMAINYFNKIHKLPFMFIKASPNRTDITDSLASICQSLDCEAHYMVKIVNYKSVITKLLACQTPTIDYSIILEIENCCKLKVSADCGKFTVEESMETPNVVLPKDMATVILLSPQLSYNHGLPFFVNLYVTTQDNV